jgi:GH35 family endo-1,4-beta-xylanase
MGEPVPLPDIRDAMVLDLEFTPAFRHAPRAAVGRATLPVPAAPFAVSMPLPVEGFGHVIAYADNGGVAYHPDEVSDKVLNFCLEAATSRTAAVSRAEASFRKLGTKPSADYVDRLSKAQDYLESAREKEADEVACAKLAMSSLCESLHAGEMLVVEHARSQIAAAPMRRGFLFGCKGFRYPELGETYAELFGRVFNFAILPFYRAQREAREGERDFSRVEKILEWTTRDGIQTKGQPLVWFHDGGTPEWLRDRDYEQVQAAHRDYILDAVGRFRDRVKFWDVIREAHDWANDFGYTPDQLMAMTRLATDVTREADPEAIRIVNCCRPWSDYVAHGRNYSREIGHPARSVLQYLRDIIDAGVEFEAIGLQMYYPQRDLFEIDRQLDRFGRLGKPVHVTELGVSSSTLPAEHYEWLRVHFARYWHGPWSESEQADWLAAFAALCYSKPAVEAMTWWDLCDPAGVPHGGLLDGDLRPKESYHRLHDLVKHWQLAP